MNTPLQLIRLGELEIPQHVDLHQNDNCFYWRKYTTGKGYTYGETNQLIKNFQISLTEPQKRLYHKSKAIEKIANELIQVITKDSVYKDYTFIPVPTSKGRGNDDYDDRLLKTLNRVSELKKIKMDIREVIIQKSKTQQAHTVSANKRLSIDELCHLYTVQEKLLNPITKKIIIFDDVLTKGSHFKAMEKTLKPHYPEIPISGLFIACSVFPDPFSDDT